MVKGLIGRKMNMSQRYDLHGRAVPVTKVLVEPNFVLQIKTKEKDGYKALQLGTGNKKEMNKPITGHIKKAKINSSPRVLREVAFDGDIKLGQEVKAGDVFSKGSLVDVTGLSKGKGFTGVVKRYGFAGGPRTHGQSDRERAPGSIGATTTPGRVFKGKKMARQVGMERIKVQALGIISVDKDENIVEITGSLPGPTGSFLLIEKSKKIKKKYHEPEVTEVPALRNKEEKPTEGEPGTVTEKANQAEEPVNNASDNKSSMEQKDSAENEKNK